MGVQFGPFWPALPVSRVAGLGFDRETLGGRGFASSCFLVFLSLGSLRPHSGGPSTAEAVLYARRTHTKLCWSCNILPPSLPSPVSSRDTCVLLRLHPPAGQAPARSARPVASSSARPPRLSSQRTSRRRTYGGIEVRCQPLFYYHQL